jgi:hypothetical protein
LTCYHLCADNVGGWTGRSNLKGATNGTSAFVTNGEEAIMFIAAG